MRGQKQCNECGEVKPYKDYPFGKARVSAKCKQCAYARKNDSRRKGG